MKYLDIIEPKYIYLKITPHKSIRNYNTTNIALAIKHLYKTIFERIHMENKKLIIEKPLKISYIVDIYSNDMSFYFLTPLPYKSIIIEKVREIWSKVTIEEHSNIKKFENYTAYQVAYKNENAFSLKVDKKSNNPLNNIMNVMEIMKDDDRITIINNFIPRKNLGWEKEYNDSITKFKEHKSILNNKLSAKYIVLSIITFVFSVIEDILCQLNEILGNNINKDKDLGLVEALVTMIDDTKRNISESTSKKGTADVIDCQIAILSESNDKNRSINNIKSIIDSYRSIDDDNKLIGKRIKNKVNFEDYTLKNVDTNTFSIDECQNIIQIPAKELLEQFKISHVNTEETQVPVELQSGAWCIGINTYKGNKQKGYLSTDSNFRNLPLCTIAPNRSGKTTLLKHLSKDAIENGECVILFDFCGECEFSDDVSKAIPKEKVLNIDLSDFNNLQGLGFNECKPKNNDKFEVYKSAKMQTAQLVNFINAININNPLENRMNRYLKSASIIVFINSGSIKDVFDVLQDYKVRNSFIKKCPSNQKDNLNEYIVSLNELDEYSKSTKDCEPQVIGTKISYIQAILNRLDIIKSNAFMELMLKKDCTNNIDLVEEIQKNQLICLRIPETMFSTDEEKDVYCNYWMNKIWGALQQRHSVLKEKDRIKVNIFVDELYQVITTQSFLKKILNQIAKKTAKIIISAHSLEQIKYIRPELKNASTSYMLIAGCGKDNYNELKEELQPYELDDLLNLKRYHSLNLIKTSDGYAKFITKLPS